MTYYDDLGVPQGADKETIKRAYRKKASAAHPDKGGTVEEMQHINRAYECLTDDSQRDQYDRTGKDERIDMQAKVDAVIDGLLNEIIENGEDASVNLIERMKVAVRTNNNSHNAQAAEARRNIRKYEKQGKRIKGPNIQRIIESKLRACNQAIANADEWQNINELVLKALDAYSDVGVPERTGPTVARFIVDQSSTSGAVYTPTKSSW